MRSGRSELNTLEEKAAEHALGIVEKSFLFIQQKSFG